MGLTLEFHAGDKSRIITAIQEIDYDSLDNPEVSKFKVDLSLHITPHDLDLLSESIGEAKSAKPIQLGPYLNGIVDEVDRGALEVAGEWINYVAATDTNLVRAIAESWKSKIAKEYPNEDIQMTNEMIEAIQALLEFAKRASTEPCDVVHIWLL
jgi:hypothetical protein